MFDDNGGTVDLTAAATSWSAALDIGDFTQVAGVLTITFDPDANSARVDEVLQQLTYQNTSDAPPDSVVVAYTFNDGNTGAQGSGGAGIATGSITVNITPVNDAPDANAVNGGDIAYLENQAPTPFDPWLTVTDPDDTELEGARVTLDRNFVAGAGRARGRHRRTGSSGDYNAGTGVLDAGRHRDARRVRAGAAHGHVLQFQRRSLDARAQRPSSSSTTAAAWSTSATSASP